MNLESDMSKWAQSRTVVGPTPASSQKLLARLREVAEIVRNLNLPGPGVYLACRVRGEQNAFPLVRVTRVGRSPDAEISLEDPWLSHIHFICMQTPEGIVLSDPGSSNGTFVNGERVSRKPIVPGDIIRAGDTIFALVEETPPPVP